MDSISCRKQLRIARACLALAVVAAAFSWFLPWEIIGDQFFPRDKTITARGMLNAASFGTSPLPVPTFAEFCVVVIMMELALVLSFLAAPFVAEVLTRSRLLKWLWIFVDLGMFICLLVGWNKVKYTFFALSDWDLYFEHRCYLPGFYFGTAAAFLHFIGLILIPSAKSLLQTGVVAEPL